MDTTDNNDYTDLFSEHFGGAGNAPPRSDAEYCGRIAFIERDNPDNSYYNGQYIIAKKTPGMIYGLGLIPGYYSSYLRTFSLVGGSEAAHVVEGSLYEDWDYVKSYIAQVENFIRLGGKYREHVYDKAAENLHLLKHGIKHLL